MLELALALSFLSFLASVTSVMIAVWLPERNLERIENLEARSVILEKASSIQTRFNSVVVDDLDRLEQEVYGDFDEVTPVVITPKTVPNG
jgi:hypothetical protein